MSKVIQVRGVPDDVHAKLVEAADAAGMSLTGFLNRQLERVAREADSVRHNRELIAALRVEWPGLSDDGGVSTVKQIQEMREQRTEEILRRSRGTKR